MWFARLRFKAFEVGECHATGCDDNPAPGFGTASEPDLGAAGAH